MSRLSYARDLWSELAASDNRRAAWIELHGADAWERLLEEARNERQSQVESSAPSVKSRSKVNMSDKARLFERWRAEGKSPWDEWNKLPE